jgi:hypothetical protein
MICNAVDMRNNAQLSATACCGPCATVRNRLLRRTHINGSRMPAVLDLELLQSSRSGGSLLRTLPRSAVAHCERRLQPPAPAFWGPAWPLRRFRAMRGMTPC